MKKKSLLVLPVLLLALAACNKEEEEVEPEVDTPEVTVPETGDEGGDEGDQKTQIDSRITLVKVSLSFEGSDITYQNETDLTITSTTQDDKGNVTYVLGGTASSMSASQANEFWSGVAAAGDAYIIITVTLNEGEKVSWTASDNKEKSANVTEDIIIRISGEQIGEDKAAGYATYTITGSDGEEVTHTVDFSNVTKIDSRVAVTKGTAYLDCPAVTYENENGLSIASKTAGEGGITYTLSGVASNLTSDQATNYWPEVATEDDGYIVLTVSLNEGETVSWTSPAGAKSIEYSAMQRTGEEDMILRISGQQSYGCDSATTVAFTITSTVETLDGNDDNTTSVTHTIDFSKVAVHTHPPVLEETCAPACSLGMFDFAALTSENASTSSLKVDEDSKAILSKAWKEPTCECVTYEEVTPCWELSAVERVYPGANGVYTNTSNDYWQFSYQCLQFGSSGNNGSLTLDFTGVEVSKVAVTALSWSGSSKLSVNGDAKDITESALNTTITAPTVTYTWDLSSSTPVNELDADAVDSITISATNRVLVFSITVWGTSAGEE